MKRKKKTLYDSQESQILQQSSAFVEFLTRKGVLADQEINDEKVRKAKQSTALKAYHNTEVLLEQYADRSGLFQLTTPPTPEGSFHA